MISGWLRVVGGVIGAACCVGLTAEGLSAYPEVVLLTEEIVAASAVTVVQIESYAYGHVICKDLESGLRLGIKCSEHSSWIPPFFVTNLEPIGTGIWPAVGSEVLVVADSGNVVSVFARREDGAWRFWSPDFTESEALFECPSSARCVEGSWRFHFCFEGCLVPDVVVWDWLKHEARR